MKVLLDECLPRKLKREVNAEFVTTVPEVGWANLGQIRYIMKPMRILNFTVVMTPDLTGGYVVTCPALPGLVTEGDTLEEARAMATDAIQGYLESLKKDGEPIPTDESITEQLAVEVA
jgi:predicted RNase H-like HicB family nuclease